MNYITTKWSNFRFECRNKLHHAQAPRGSLYTTFVPKLYLSAMMHGDKGKKPSNILNMVDSEEVTEFANSALRMHLREVTNVCWKTFNKVYVEDPKRFQEIADTHVVFVDGHASVGLSSLVDSVLTGLEHVYALLGRDALPYLMVFHTVSDERFVEAFPSFATCTHLRNLIPKKRSTEINQIRDANNMDVCMEVCTRTIFAISQSTLMMGSVSTGDCIVHVADRRQCTEVYKTLCSLLVDSRIFEVQLIGGKGMVVSSQNLRSAFSIALTLQCRGTTNLTCRRCHSTWTRTQRSSLPSRNTCRERRSVEEAQITSRLHHRMCT